MVLPNQAPAQPIAQQTVTQPTAAPQDPFQQSAGLIGQAGDAYSGFLEPGGSLQNINDYMNPYYDQVLQSVLGNMETQQQLGLNQIGDQAEAGSAFGGARHGLQEGIFRGEHSRAVGDVSGNLLMQQFDSAADRSYRDQVTGAQGSSQVGDQLYGIGTDIADRQAQAGGQQQQMMQQILSGGAGIFENFMQNPYQMMDMLQSLLSGDARRGQGTGTQQSTPGMYDYLSLGAQAAGGMG